jgi:hypothetical protein
MMMKRAQLNMPPAVNLYPGNRVLLEQWENWRGEQDVPARGAMELKPIAEYLPWIAIVEPTGERQSYRCRLAGSGLTEMWGTNMTGADLRMPCASFERDVMARLFDGALLRAEAFCARLRLLPVGEEPMVAEMLGLPVRAASGEMQMLTSVMPYSCRRHASAKGLRNIQIAGTRLMSADAGGYFIKPKARQFKLISGGTSAL